MTQVNNFAPLTNVGRVLKSTRIKTALISAMESGQLEHGELLPSENSLAEEFGVSRPTVRRALTEMEEEGMVCREQGRGTFVSKDTRKKSPKKTATYALIIRGQDDVTISSLIYGFEEACRATHHEMVLCNTGGDILQQADTVLRLSHRDDIEGVAILPVTYPATPACHIANFQDRKIPVAFCHRAAEDGTGPLLSIDHMAEGVLVGQAFAGQGHRRVALLFHEPPGPSGESMVAAWTRGIRKSLQAVGGELPEEFVYFPDEVVVDHAKREVELLASLEKMFRSENPPTAIFAITDEFAQAVYCGLEQLGLKVPEDVSLVGLGDAHRKGAFLRRLTSVVFDGADMGRQAVELLHQMGAGTRDLLDAESIAIPISLSKGQTLGPAPKQRIKSVGEARIE